MIDKRLTILPATLLLTLVSGVSIADDAEEQLDPALLEAEQVRIGNIVLEKHDIFDLSNPKENNALFRLANKLHIITKDETIEKQLLLEPGDLFSERLAAESGRILRSNRYFYDASVTPKNRRDGKVDLHVKTRDVWTLKPGLSYSRKGGETKTSISLEEINIFGRGQELGFSSTRDVDRDTSLFEFKDRHFGSNWLSVELSLANNSDGHSNFLSVARPFYALDTRWAGGGSVLDQDRVSSA